MRQRQWCDRCGVRWRYGMAMSPEHPPKPQSDHADYIAAGADEAAPGTVRAWWAIWVVGVAAFLVAVFVFGFGSGSSTSVQQPSGSARQPSGSKPKTYASAQDRWSKRRERHFSRRKRLRDNFRRSTETYDQDDRAHDERADACSPSSSSSEQQLRQARARLGAAVVRCPSLSATLSAHGRPATLFYRTPEPSAKASVPTGIPPPPRGARWGGRRRVGGAGGGAVR